MGTVRGTSIALVLVAACANAGTDTARDSGPLDGPGSGSGSDAGSGGMASMCAPGELARGITGGQVTCAPIEQATQAALDAQCSVYLGWRDQCNGCTTAPDKWGLAGGERCTNGSGIGNACTTATLGAKAVRLFKLKPEGDVDNNDKLYGTLHCSEATGTSVPTPCPADHFLVGNSTCAPLANAVVPYVRDSCQLYLGWQDGCNGCTTAPTKWGRAGDAACATGVGAENTCTTATLGSESVKLFGLSPDGDVDNNDKLHVALHCADAAPLATTATTACPAGQFVAGTLANGDLACEHPASRIAAYVRDRCTLYLGWRDQCGGCTTAPTKWGTARVGACTTGVGAENTCSTFNLGGTTVSMLGISPDGDVDDNDGLYIGLRCE